MIQQTLRTAARDSGLTQKQLAAAGNTSQRAISDFLAGKNLHADSLDRLAEAFGSRFTVPKNFAKNVRNWIADA